jgi:hypothetical protein
MEPDLPSALHVFARALDYMSAAGLTSEIEWQRQRSMDDFCESELLRETAWVILCSGFRESVVRRIFNHVSLCYCDWESASAIVAANNYCVLTAQAVFRNERKLRAILSVAQTVHDVGFDELKSAILEDPLNQLSRLPYVGPVTVWHLAKNLGLDVAKPDRHLVRVAAHLGFRDPHDFCTAIAKASGEQAKVVDLVVWRYLADNPVYARI